MNVFMEVSNLLTEAQNASWTAKQTIDHAERYGLYQIKAARISAAVLVDPTGWYLDGYETSEKIAAITYRGCWWFHVPINEFPETVSAILFDRNVFWLRKSYDVYDRPTEENRRDSWPIPDPCNYFRNGYRSLSGAEE